jgi:hypothetical protein
MGRIGAVIVVVALVWTADLGAQRRRPPARKPKPAPPAALKVEPAAVKCAEVLGTGVRTAATFCFVLAGRDPAEGVLVPVPPNTEATLLFDLHNRHTYSEEEMRAGRRFAKYMAVIGVLTMKGELVSRAAVQSEFRGAGDLYDRITGGAGPGGVKAVAPIGREQVIVPLPAGIDQVSLIGLVLDATTAAGHETATPGRPVALVSNVRVEFRPKR